MDLFMNRHVLRLLCLLLPCCHAAKASEALPFSADQIDKVFSQGRVTTFVDIENDSMLLNHRDGFYTNGLRLTRSYRLPVEYGWQTVGWRFGQQLYTSIDVRLRPEEISPLDHPYAGWLYGGMFTRAEYRDGSDAYLGFDVGCLGPCAGGEATQKFIHRVLHQPRPYGWSTQLSNEPGLVLHAGGRAPFWKLGSHVDVRPGLALRLGNIFTDLSVDASLRAGQLSSAGSDGFIFGFARFGLRAVGYDATLQGGLFADETARTVKPKRLTGEFELGLQWWRRQWGVRVSAVRRSNEIEGLSEEAGRQDFLRISISYTP